jgi:hypothetical protein
MQQCSLPNQDIHMDLFNPLTNLDMFTKYTKVGAIQNKEVESVADTAFTM